MDGSVVQVYVAPAPGKPMAAVDHAELETGRGIAGDRYHAGVGTFSAKLRGRPDREVTLVEAEEIERFNAGHGLALDYGALRRNIVTRGVRLNDLVGRQFRVGDALLEGIRLCEPCKHLARLVDPAVLPALEQRAGLRARIVTGGVVRSGDRVGPPD